MIDNDNNNPRFIQAAVALIFAVVLFPIAFPITAAAQPMIFVNHDADVAVDGNGDGLPNPGEIVDFTVLIQNTGMSDGTNAVVTAVLDDNLTLINGYLEIEPYARPDALSIVEDDVPNTVSGNLLANDLGADTGQTLRIVRVNSSDTPGTVVTSFGSITWSANGNVTYTLDNTNPTVDGQNSSSSIDDFISYEISDGTTVTNMDTLRVTIQGANG